jgi:hypothetical protein
MKANRSATSEQATTRLEARAAETGESGPDEPLLESPESGADGGLRSRAWKDRAKPPYSAFS